jgi:hypothetical protein
VAGGDTDEERVVDEVGARQEGGVDLQLVDEGVALSRSKVEVAPVQKVQVLECGAGFGMPCAAPNPGALEVVALADGQRGAEDVVHDAEVDFASKVTRGEPMHAEESAEERVGVLLEVADILREKAEEEGTFGLLHGFDDKGAIGGVEKNGATLSWGRFIREVTGSAKSEQVVRGRNAKLVAESVKSLRGILLELSSEHALGRCCGGATNDHRGQAELGRLEEGLGR